MTIWAKSVYLKDMFTGIIKYLGKIKKIENKDSVYITIECKELIPQLEIGSSIAHDGVCLSILEIYSDSYMVQLMPETMQKTAFANKKVGDIVNLEGSLKLQDIIDGHLVQGHVDGVGEVTSYIQDGDNWVLRIKPPQELFKYIAQKGSVALNGVSLTVSKRLENTFEVSLIKHTIENTNLGNLQVGGLVNIEIDILARYLENLIKN